MVKRVLAMVLLVLLAVIPVSCTDEEEENWWEVDREEIVVAVEFPGGNPERVEEQVLRKPVGTIPTVVCPYQDGDLIVPKYYLYYKGELRNDVYVDQMEEYYLETYQEWTRWAELRAKGDYKVFIDFYAKEDMKLESFIYQVLVYLTIK